MSQHKIDLSMSLPFEVVDGEMSDAEVIEMVLKAAEEARLASRLTGSIIDSKYKILELLDEGGMGSVYHVSHMLLTKEMALKTFRTSAISPEEWERFQREARAIGKLMHPNIIQVFDFGISDKNFPYYTMELLVGESLAAFLDREEYLPVDKALDIFISVANGLAHAHRQGIIHRDIKPANIFLAQSNRTVSPKIVDFGLAKLASTQNRDIQSLTTVGKIYGSPLYMSPEQSRGRSMDERTDIYSFGCTLYHALTGRPPYIGENLLQVVRQHQTADPPRLADAAPQRFFLPQLESVFVRLLVKDKEKRYQSFEEVERDLQAVEALVEMPKAVVPPQSPPPADPPALVKVRAAASVKNEIDYSTAAQLIETAHRMERPSVAAAGGPKPVVIFAVFVSIITTGSIMFFLNSKATERTESSGLLPSFTDHKSGDYFSQMAGDFRRFSFPAEPPGIGQIFWEGQEVRPGNGTVYVPEHAHLHLIAGPLLSEQPDLFRKFRPDDLSALTLPSSSWWGSSSFQEVSNLTMLESLDLANTFFKSADVASISTLQRLTRLDVSSTNLTGADLAGLPLTQQLHYLNADKLHDLGPLLSRLKNNKTLTELSLRGCDLNDVDLETISTISNLHALNLDFNLFTLAGLDHLTALTNLESLDIVGAQFNVEAIDVLKKFSHLRKLKIMSLSWDEKDRQRLKESMPIGCVVEED